MFIDGANTVWSSIIGGSYKVPVIWFESDKTIEGKHICCKTPYNELFIGHIKHDVSPKDRGWIPDKSIWILKRGDFYISFITNLLLECYTMFIDKCAEIPHVKVKNTLGEIEIRSLKDVPIFTKDELLSFLSSISEEDSGVMINL
jgi:hypothetical protein